MKRLILLVLALPLASTSFGAQTDKVERSPQSPPQMTAPGAQAGACNGLTQLASVELVPIPGSDRMAAPVIVDGMRENLLVSTSGGVSSLTMAAGRALGLNARDTGSVRVLDTNGYASHRYFYLKNVQVGRLLGKGLLFMTTADPDFGKAPPLNGILAADLMAAYDVEIDFAGHRMIYYSPDHCPGQVIYWPARIVGVSPITLVSRSQDKQQGGNPGLSSTQQTMLMESIFTGYAPMHSNIVGLDIRTPVVLDGKSFTANIDTGQEVSTLNSDAARAVFTVTAKSPDSAPADTQRNGRPTPPGASETVIVRGIKLFVHTFHTLALAGVTVNSPRLLVQPDITGTRDGDNRLQTGSLIGREDDFPRPDITIGMDILRHLHLYFAFQERKLYVTPAGNPN